MSLWKDVIAPHIFEETDASKEKTTPEVTAKPSKITDVQGTPILATGTAFKAPTEVHPEFLAALIEEVNRDTDPTLTHFLTLLTSFEDIIPDQRMKFQAAIAAAKQQGVDMPRLLQAANGRLTLLDRETEEFEADMRDKEAREVGEKEKQVTQINQQITDLQGQISDLTAQQNAMKKEIVRDTEKLTIARSRFAAASDALRLKFDGELQMIKSNIQP